MRSPQLGLGPAFVLVVSLSFGCAPAPSSAASGPATVALIDTGVALESPALVHAERIAAGSADPTHGTHLASILVEAGVQVVSLDVFDDHAASFEAVRAAFAWCIANRDRYGLRVINLSLGTGVSRALCPTESLAGAIEDAARAGLLTVVAAGDQGYTEALAVPACAPSAVSVGTVADGDGVAPFSNSAPFLTLLAPGIAVAARGTVLSGTSQSAAAVSAAAAHLAAAHPADRPDVLRDRLVTFGTPLRDARNGVVTPALRPPYPKELRE